MPATYYRVGKPNIYISQTLLQLGVQRSFRFGQSYAVHEISKVERKVERELLFFSDKHSCGGFVYMCVALLIEVLVCHHVTDLQGDWKIGYEAASFASMNSRRNGRTCGSFLGSTVLEQCWRECKKGRSSLDDQALWYSFKSHFCQLNPKLLSTPSNFVNASMSYSESLPAFIRVDLVFCK